MVRTRGTGRAVSVESSDGADPPCPDGLTVNLSVDLYPGHIIATGRRRGRRLTLIEKRPSIMDGARPRVSVPALEGVGNIADTKDFAIVDSASSIDMGVVNFADPASVTAQSTTTRIWPWYTGTTNATDASRLTGSTLPCRSSRSTG